MYKRISNISKSQSFFLFGPRGSGKSTLLKTLFSKDEALWIDLLENKTELTLQQNPDLLLELWKKDRPKWVVIDEVQKIPAILDVVHRGIENHKIKFALTGSSSRKLKRGGANLLANRVASYHLSPFNSLELGDDFKLSEALQYGLLPRFWNLDENLTEQDKVRSLYAYVQTYLKEEIAAEQLVRNLDPFRRLLMIAAQMNGNPLNFSAIEREAMVSPTQAERHYEILVDTYIGNYLHPYDTSIRRRQSKRSKFYFFDTGVVRALMNLAEEPLNSSTYDYGKMFETFVINEFFKLIQAFEKKWELTYFTTKDNAEIDLIIEKPRGKPILIEIKSSNSIKSPDSVRNFQRISKEFPGSRKIILSNTKSAFVAGELEFFYWQEGLREIFKAEIAVD